MKVSKVIISIFLLLTLSCQGNKDLLLIDPAFYHLNIDQIEFFNEADLILYKKDEESSLLLENYKRIICSPLVYKNIKSIEQYSNVIVLDYQYQDLLENHFTYNFSYKDATSLFLQTYSNGEVLGIVTDEGTDLGVDFSDIYYVGNEASRISMGEYIKGKDIVLVATEKHLDYFYMNFKDEVHYIIYNGQNIRDNNKKVYGYIKKKYDDFFKKINNNNYTSNVKIYFY